MRVPATERCFEDYAVGDVDHFGAYAVTEQEIVEFARRYDPQPFHVNAQAAGESISLRKKPAKASASRAIGTAPIAAKRSASKPDRGVVWTSNEVIEQRGEVVMTCKAMGMYRCRSLPQV